MWLLVPEVVVPAFQKQLSSRYSCWDIKFTENDARSKKHPVTGSSVGENILLMREAWGECEDSFKLTERPQMLKLPLFTNVVCRRAPLNTQRVEPWSEWATAAEDHTWCHSCQLRIERWGCSQWACGHQSWMTDPGKMLKGLTNLSAATCRW